MHCLTQWLQYCTACLNGETCYIFSQNVVMCFIWFSQ
jgi:hypothetical protein